MPQAGESSNIELDNVDDQEELCENENNKGESKQCFRWWRRRCRKSILVAILIVCNGFYLYFGALIFLELERKYPKEPNVKEQMTTILKALQSTEAANNTLPAFNVEAVIGNLSESDKLKLNSTIQSIHNEWSAAEKDRWTIYSAVFFATTVVTTIGYGNIAPSTVGGRVFCMIYAVLGIPLTLMLLAVVGGLLADYLNHLCGMVVHVIRRYLHHDYEWDTAEGESELNAPVWLAVMIVFIFMSLMAGFYSYLENWSFATAFYFLFVTLTTIGFGDVVPRYNFHTIVWLNTTMLYLGLALVAIIINLLIVHLTRHVSKTKKHLKFIDRLERNSTMEIPDEEAEKNLQRADRLARINEADSSSDTKLNGDMQSSNSYGTTD